MSLRMRDFRCRVCEYEWEAIVNTENLEPQLHCGEEPMSVPGAPAIKFCKPHFNRGLGKWITDANSLDRELKKAGAHIPTGMNDKARALELPAIEDQGAAERKTKRDERIRQIAQKTESELNLGGYLKKGELPGRLQDKVERATRKLKQA